MNTEYHSHEMNLSFEIIYFQFAHNFSNQSNSLKKITRSSNRKEILE